MLNLYYTYFPNFRRSISKWWYEYISKVDSSTKMLFMNYGYASLDSKQPMMKLKAGDEENRYSIQLYHHLASAVDLSGKDVLEIGSGRGGGASYISRYLKPKSMVGVDITANAIKFCEQQYSIPGLSFEQGDAEALHFADNSFDVVLNVESSNCYPNITKFFTEVVRVLKPGGYFLYADLRKKRELAVWQEQMAGMGLTLKKQEDITANVLRALQLDNERKRDLIAQYAPKLIHKPFHEFAGMEGSGYVYGSLENRDKLYVSYIWHKQ